MGEAVPANLHDQQRYRTPARVAVPMEEREARANRFVCQQVGDTVRRVPSKRNSEARLLQLAVIRVGHLEALLHKALAHLSDLLEQERLDPPSDQWKVPPQA